ncbi:MAG: fimbria/pilus periplasmic chaperone [Pseudomonadota bacterium]|nr:fimbria/pilus periplasmic chaperone [Pseudomonadota bacterium]
MRLLVIAAFLLIWTSGTQSWAQSLEVAPVSIQLAPDQRTTSLTVTNRSNAPVVIQIRPFLWRETDNTVTLTPTSALAVSPPFAEIASGQTQSVRIVLREPPGVAEATYRVFVDQLPPANAPGIHVALRLSLPVFAAPSARAAAALVWQVIPTRAGPELEVHNRGNRHATITAAQIRGPAGGTTAVRTSTHPYVLTGATAHWPIGGPSFSGSGPVRLTVTSDTGVQDVTASVANAPQ